MTRKAMWGLAAAAVVVLGVFAITGFPPVGRGTEGTIGAAKKYQAPQIADKDVVTGDASAQQFLQSDTFAKLLKDPAARKALSDPQLARELSDPSLAAALRNADLEAALRDPSLAAALQERGFGRGPAERRVRSGAAAAGSAVLEQPGARGGDAERVVRSSAAESASRRGLAAAGARAGAVGCEPERRAPERGVPAGPEQQRVRRGSEGPEFRAGDLTRKLTASGSRVRRVTNGTARWSGRTTGQFCVRRRRSRVSFGVTSAAS